MAVAHIHMSTCPAAHGTHPWWFSHSGAQVSARVAQDEAICPCDMNVITDDDLRAIFMPLKDKPGVKLTFIADCCHRLACAPRHTPRLKGGGGPLNPRLSPNPCGAAARCWTTTPW